MNFNMMLLRYFVSTIIVFFGFFAYHFVLGKNTDFLSFFYTAHLAFDGALMFGLLLRAFVCLFEHDSKPVEDENQVEFYKTSKGMRG